MRRTGHEHPGHWGTGRELRKGAVALLEAFPVRVRALAIALAVLLIAVALLGQSTLPVSAASEASSTVDVNSQATDASLSELPDHQTEMPLVGTVSEPPNGGEPPQPQDSNAEITCSTDPESPIENNNFTLKFEFSGHEPVIITRGANKGLPKDIYVKYKIHKIDLENRRIREILDADTKANRIPGTPAGNITTTYNIKTPGVYQLTCILVENDELQDEGFWDGDYYDDEETDWQEGNEIYNFDVLQNDTTPPNKPRLSSPINGAEDVNDTTPTLEWSKAVDNTGGSGIKEIQVIIRGADSDLANDPVLAVYGTATSFTPNFVLDYGTYYWRVGAFDNRGNVTWSDEWSFKIVNPPTVNSLGCSLPSRVYVGASITCNPNLGGGAPTSYSWSAPDGNPSSGTGSTFTTKFTATGNSRIYLTVENNDGAVSRSELITVVNRAPRLSDRSPSGNLTGNSKLILGSNNSVSRNFSVDASDSDGNLRRVEWYVDDQLEETDTLTSGTARFAARFTAEDTYTVEAIAYDGDGASDTERWRVRVEELEEITTNTPPTINSYSPNERQISLSAGQMSRRFTVTVQDPDNDLKQINWVLEFPNGLEEVTSKPRNAGGAIAITDSYSRDFSSLSAGTYNVRAEITDQEGAEASRSWTVTVPGTDDDETVFDNPWTDGTEILHEITESSWAIGPVNVPDTKVLVGLKPPSAGQPLSTLKIRLERIPSIEVVRTLGDQVIQELAKLLGVTPEKLKTMTVYDLAITMAKRGKEWLAREGYDVSILELPELPEGPEFLDSENLAEGLGVSPEVVEASKKVMTGLLLETFTPIPPGIGQILVLKGSDALPEIYEKTAKMVLERALEAAIRDILLPERFRNDSVANSKISEASTLMANWLVENQRQLEGNARSELDAILSDLRRYGVPVELIGDFVDVLVTVAVALPATSMAIPGLGAIASLIIFDSAIGFDGMGRVSVSVPKSAWIEHTAVQRNVKYWWIEDYAPYTYTNEEDALLLSRSAEYLTDTVVGVGLDAVGVVPILGDAAGLVIGFTLDTVEYASDAAFLTNPELDGPRNVWLRPETSNCTNRITVPWDLGFLNVRGIEITVPIQLSNSDYVSIYSDFSRLTSGDLLLRVNWPFIRQSGEVEINDVLDTGRGGNAPRCDLATFDAPPPPVLTATPGITAAPAALAVAEGGSASYSVMLDSRPSADVRVSINAPTRTDVRISHSNLTFEPSNWDTRQTVTVRALQDDDTAIDPFVTLAHTASGGDYTGTASENVVVVIEEDDVAAPSRAGPDLVVQSFSPSDATPEPSGRFTLNATVLNQGDEDAGSSTLRYYLSTDTHISTSDTVVGTDGVSSLAVSRTGNESMSLNASATAGTYYYGACVDAVAGEANTANNCSTVVAVTVAGQDPEEVITEEVITEPSEGDRGVLETLYNATDGPNWRAQRRWMSSASISSWQGVVVDANGNVTQLILAGYGLSGSIPPELGDLANLATLHLSGNSLTGCVPAALRNVPDNDFASLGLPFCGAAPITTGPQNGDRIFFNGGTLNDQPVNRANPTLTVGTGQAISGTVNLTVHKDHSAAARFPVVATPTWGDHERSYWRVPISAPAFGNADGTARINLTAPGSPGEYAIIFVAQAQTTGGHVASATHWASGSPRWNNGDEVASWGSAAIDSAIRNGYVLAPQQGWTQANGHFGAAAIRVIVTAAPTRMEAPDLVVETYTADNRDAISQEPFRFDAIVRNQGAGEAASTTLRYYVSTDSTIDTSDSPIGTDPISRIPASGMSNESVTMYAHPVGTLYYGACVDAVANETNTANNCTRGVAVTAIIIGVPPPSREVLIITSKTPPSPVFLTTGERQSFSARAMGADNNINGWEWSLDGVFQDGQTLVPTIPFPFFPRNNIVPRNFSHTFSMAGTYTVKLTFTYADGESTSESWTVRVTDALPANRPPAISSKTPSSPVSLTTGDMQSFSATGTDADGNVNAWEWFLDDVSQDRQSLALTGSITRSFSHTFSSAGTYTVKVTFTDADGESASDTWTVQVTEPQSTAPDLVVSSFSASESTVNPEERITLRATVLNQGGEDADSTTLRYYRSADSTIDTGDTQLATDDVWGLRPNRDTDESERLEAPGDAGTYYFGACVDTVTGESDTQNNCSSGVAVTVLGVDLVVHSESVSDTRVELNEYFDFSATVENQGEGEADSSTLRYYRSEDSTIDASDTELFTENLSGLDPDETSNETEELFTPTTAGTYYFGVCVDVVAGESDTQNNCSTGVEITVVEGDPNLDIALTRLTDNILGTGVSFTLAATVRNYGQGDAASTTLRYYRSTDSSISSSDTLLGTDSVGSLGAEETEDHSQSVTTPDSSGTYYFGACVDPVAGEEIRYDNCSRMAVGVGDVSPDLEVYSPSVYEWTLDPGKRFNMGFQVRNRGTGPSPSARAEVSYYRSDDSTISASDTEVSGRGDTSVSTMDPSTTEGMEYQFTVHSSGTYYYGACVEEVNRETVTSNNCAAILRVTVN